MKFEESSLHDAVLKIANELSNFNTEVYDAENKAKEIAELCGDGDLRTITFYNNKNEECFVRFYKSFVNNMSLQTKIIKNQIEVGKMVKFN